MLVDMDQYILKVIPSTPQTKDANLRSAPEIHRFDPHVPIKLSTLWLKLYNIVRKNLSTTNVQNYILYKINRNCSQVLDILTRGILAQIDIKWNVLKFTLKSVTSTALKLFTIFTDFRSTWYAHRRKWMA